MDGTDNGGVTTEQLLALIGAKEVEIQMLRQQAEAQRQRIAELSAQIKPTEGSDG